MMAQATKRAFVFLTLLAAVVALALWFTRPADSGRTPTLALAQLTPAAPFDRAFSGRSFEFPADHGPHESFQTEWWYYTGNLEAEDGQRFGYQLTFFRRALTAEPLERGSTFATDQIYFAHFAITEVEKGLHFYSERFSRSVEGLAGAQGEPFKVWLEDWRASAFNPAATEQSLYAAEGGFELDLTLEASKPVVVHGEQGLSVKSSLPGDASYYLSFTRLKTRGTLRIADQEFEVEGESWFDHEWSTSALGAEAVGWDWFSLQFDDGRELMLYQIRLSSGGLDPVSGGTLVERDGTSRGLTLEELSVESLDTWRSPETGAEYPSGWAVQVPGEGLDLTIIPFIPNQEMRVSFAYWEGAVRITGEAAGAPLSGVGYVELTGYESSMQGVF